MEHTNPILLLDGKRSPLLATTYSPTILTAEAYTEGVARWPTAILKSGNHADDVIFPEETKSYHVSQIKLH